MPNALKVIQISKYCCEIWTKYSGIPEKLCAKISMEIFDDYPSLKSNSWSWGDTNSAELNNIIRNGSRSRIGKVSKLEYAKVSKSLIIKLAKAMAMNLKFRVLIIPETYRELSATDDDVLQTIHPKGMKESTYFAFIPGHNGGVKSQMIRVEEIQSYFSEMQNEGQKNEVDKIKSHISEFAKKKNVVLRKLTKYEPTLSGRQFQHLCKGYVNVNLFDYQRSLDGADGFYVQRKNEILGVALFAPFHKDNYPPPFTQNGSLDKADPIFYVPTGEEKNDVTEKIYRGYDLHVLCAEKSYGRLLLAAVLTEIRKIHGRAVTLSIGQKDGHFHPNALNLYREFGFDDLLAKFSFRYGGGVWKTQVTLKDPVDEPLFLTRLVDSSKNLITLEGVRKFLNLNF